jgi:hypothetical protein
MDGLRGSAAFLIVIVYLFNYSFGGTLLLGLNLAKVDKTEG